MYVVMVHSSGSLIKLVWVFCALKYQNQNDSISQDSDSDLGPPWAVETQRDMNYHPKVTHN